MKRLLSGYARETLLIVDGTHIRSVDGSEGLGYGYKEHGKKALKITAVADTNKIIRITGICPDNLSDNTAFLQLARAHPSQTPVDVLADAGYVGKEFKEEAFNLGYRVISPQKRFKFGASSPPTPYETLLLKRHRPKVVHIFGRLKRFKSIQVKSVKTLATFNTFLAIAVLIVNLHNGVIRKGLKRRVPIRLTPYML